jgi:hypothetical protein
MLLAFSLPVLAAPAATGAEPPLAVRERPFEEFDFRSVGHEEEGQ